MARRLDREAVKPIKGVCQQQELGLGVQPRPLSAAGIPGGADFHARSGEVDVM